TGAGYSGEGEIHHEDAAVGEVQEGPLFTTLLTGVLANEADPSFLNGSDPIGDPTELALYASAAKAGLAADRVRKEYGQIDILPFESEQRFMATLNETPDERRIF